MKNLFKLLITLSLIGGICSCGPTWRARHQKSTDDVTMGASMKAIQHIYGPWQIDSMCVADTLKPIDEWPKSTFIDYETGTPIIKQMYIKNYTSKSEIIYTLLSYQDTLYVVTIRTAKSE